MGEPRERQVVWHRTRYCESGACVEVASDGKNILVRDPNDCQDSHLIVPPGSWQDFLDRIRT